MPLPTASSKSIIQRTAGFTCGSPDAAGAAFCARPGTCSALGIVWPSAAASGLPSGPYPMASHRSGSAVAVAGCAHRPVRVPAFASGCSRYAVRAGPKRSAACAHSASAAIPPFAAAAAARCCAHCASSAVSLGVVRVDVEAVRVDADPEVGAAVRAGPGPDLDADRRHDERDGGRDPGRRAEQPGERHVELVHPVAVHARGRRE